MVGLSRLRGHVGDVLLHKHCTLLYYSVRLSRALVGLVFSPISPLLEKCAATATHHRLAQGWANACDTRVERLLRLLRNKSVCTIIHTAVRSLVIFRTRFEQFSWRSKEPVRQAVSGILYTDTRLQFVATDTASIVFVESQ